MRHFPRGMSIGAMFRATSLLLRSYDRRPRANPYSLCGPRRSTWRVCRSARGPRAAQERRYAVTSAGRGSAKPRYLFRADGYQYSHQQALQPVLSASRFSTSVCDIFAGKHGGLVDATVIVDRRRYPAGIYELLDRPERRYWTRVRACLVVQIVAIRSVELDAITSSPICNTLGRLMQRASFSP
jgi:hypothetical protein